MSLLLLLIMFLLGLVTFGTTTTTVSEASVSAPVAEPAVATLTIHNWVCPADFTGANYAQDCDAPVADMPFELTAPITASAITDASGTVAFPDLPAATYEVTGGPPGEFVQNAITCYITDLEKLALPFLPRDNRAIGVTLVDTDITCDWYSIPENLRGNAAPPAPSIAIE